MSKAVPATLAATLALAAPLLDGAAARAHEQRGDENVRCLALSMYWEAKGQGHEGMLAVGSVVLNRMRSDEFPDSACEVVFEGGETPPCQFSWWCDGKSDTPTEAKPWKLAQELAREMLANPPADPTGGALFFHSEDIPKPWKKERTRTAQVGGHIYYR